MFETSKIELSRSALKQNLDFIQAKLKPNVRYCSVVKGNAYGHGIVPFARMAMELGVSCFGVYSADEAYRLLESCTSNKPDIFIMGSVDGDALNWAIEQECEIAVFNRIRFDELLNRAKRLRKKAHIHLEVETGLWRTGFLIEQLPEIAEICVKNSDLIHVAGLFTHLAGAESKANHFRIVEQFEKVKQAETLLAESGIKPDYIHTACSAAIMNYPDAPGNMVRIGILQYGFWPNRETKVRHIQHNTETLDELKRVIRWTSQVMEIQQINRGEFVGYGTAYLTVEPIKTAIIPVGYSHGYNRNLSNQGHILIKGKFAPVVGLVNMNSITVDISSIPNVEIGDEVVLIGTQRRQSISVSSFSEQAQQLNYELLTRLPFKIPRFCIK